MPAVFDNEQAEIPICCSNCGNMTMKTLAWVKVHPTFRCAECGEDSLEANDLRRKLQKVEKALGEFLADRLSRRRKRH